MNPAITSCIICAYAALSLFFCQHPANAQGPGVALFHKGQYSTAYAALWPGISAGDPEAAFYGLIIRRNGLDGRAAAEPQEIAALWHILNSNAELMRQALSASSTPKLTKAAYCAALTQLEYFGPTPPSWPPGQALAGQIKQARSFSSPLSGVLQGFTPAMNFQAFLAFNAFEGREKTAFKLSLKAAEAGDHLAMANLAWLYREGFGTAKNNLRAAHWARRGAEAVPPVARSQNELAYCYEIGLGVTADLQEAARWYRGSAAHGYLPGLANAGRLKRKGNTSDEASLERRLNF